MGALRGVAFFGFLWALAFASSSQGITVSGQLGDGNFLTNTTFSFSNGSLVFGNSAIRPSEYTPGVWSESTSGMHVFVTSASIGSGSVSFVYENTLTLNGVTQPFSRAIDVIWQVEQTTVVIHPVSIQFDLGLDDIVHTRFYDLTLNCGHGCGTEQNFAFIPEPATGVLVTAGLVALGFRRTRSGWIARRS